LEVRSVARRNELIVKALDTVKARYGGELPKSEFVADLTSALGTGCLQVHDATKAIWAFETALATANAFTALVPARFGLVRAYLQLGQLEDARQQFQAAAETVRVHGGWDLKTFCVGDDEAETLRKLLKKQH
jgi:Tfp pilus assembly protein PilF